MDQEMDEALARGAAVVERSHDELVGREEVVVSVQRRGRGPAEGATFRAHIDDEQAVAKLIEDSQQAIVDATKG